MTGDERTTDAHFEVLEHTADIGFRVDAPTVESLFETSARALLDIAADTSAARPRFALDLEIDGEDPGALLVNFLSEILYLFDAGRCVPAAVEVGHVTSTSVRARVLGEARVPATHPWKLIVKAVTYHGLEVGEKDGRWHARVFLDV